MAHLHTQPGGHDLTVSAFIFRERQGRVEVLVHMHRKLGMLLQPGGHVEHDENPWQAIEHELREETGFAIEQMLVLQPLPPLEGLVHDHLHPTPALLNTHQIHEGHFHTDLCFALVVDDEPRHAIAAGESLDLRWMTPAEYVGHEATNPDSAAAAAMLARDALPAWLRIPATRWRL